MVLITRGKFKGWSAGFFISPPPYPDRNSRHAMWWAVRCVHIFDTIQRESKNGTGKVVFGLVLPRSHPRGGSFSQKIESAKPAQVS